MKFLGRHSDFDTTMDAVGGEFKGKCLEKIRRMNGQIVGVHPLDDGAAILVFLTKGGRYNDRSIVNTVSTNDSCVSYANLGYQYPVTEGMDDQLEKLALGSRTPALVAG